VSALGSWLLAAAIGLIAAAVSYAGRTRPNALLALLRLLAVALLAALVLDAPVGRRAEVRPFVALDASASWTRGGDDGGWRRAVAAVRELDPDTLLLVGDSLRAGEAPTVPTDGATRLRPLVDRALAAGRPVVLISDGEGEDADALAALPAGSMRRVIAPARGRDAALLSIDAPRAAATGDTISVRVTVGTGADGAPAGQLHVQLGAASGPPARLPALGAYAEHVAAIRLVVGADQGATALVATVAAPGDAEPRNDTLAVALDVSRAAAAVLVSTAPDYDVRAILGVLRGALALPTRAYLRVAPGSWRVEGTLAAVSEDAVRVAVREAPLAVLHGDTAVFGAPRSATRAALALVVPQTRSDSAGEWYATAAPPSPLAASLSGTAWDSLPPIDVAARVAPGAWVGLEARRGRRTDPRAAVVGSDAGRRTVVVAASGFWRWQFRGGASADAFAGLWGGIFDWLAEGRADQRAAVPALASIRAGEPLRWRRGGGDSVATLTLRRRGVPSGVDTITLRFDAGATVVTGAARAAGLYDVSGAGGTSLLVVNPSRELLPQRQTVRDGRIGAGATAGDAPRLRSLGWVYALVLALLCVEWLLRRRAGLR
jgi:hypothetical protein